MAVTNVQDFLDGLQQSKLLDDQQFAEARQQSNSEDDPITVAKWLIKQGWLTKWQAEQILGGRSDFFLGKYELLERIGKGGMGAVYKAVESGSSQIVALKVMAKRLLGNRSAVARFRREIRSMSAVDHPNIVAAHDPESDDNVCFLVMEYIPGQDLSAWIKQHGQLPIDWSCEVIRQAAEGLQHAHERGLVHRDIKPSNLLVVADNLDESPAVKILDLGLARFTDDAAQSVSKITQTGQVMGTPDYLAPEQAEDSKHVDIRSDIYSLGCTLFEMLTAKPPFSGSNPAARFAVRLVKDAPAVTTLRQDVPPELDAIVAKMLARKPEDRYQTPAELVVAVTGFLGSLPKKPAAKRAAGAETANDQSEPTPNELRDRKPRKAKKPQSPGAPRKEFDPYHSWLAIPKDKRPPTHYQLLGISPDEQDADAIEAAILQRTAYVRNYQAGVHRDVACKVLDEIAQAAVTIRDPSKRQKYDADLARLHRGQRRELAQVKAGAGGLPSVSQKCWIAGGAAALVLLALIFSFLGDNRTEDQGDMTQEAKTDATSQKKAPPLASAPFTSEDAKTDATTKAGAPRPAIAPFTPEEAKQHQQRWAEYLGVPVEIENSIGMKMVLIPPGEFMMGSTDEEVAEILKPAKGLRRVVAEWTELRSSEAPQHLVKITKPLYLGIYEVTVGQFRAFIEKAGYRTEAEKQKAEWTWQAPGFEQDDDHPVARVSWNDAAAFCKWLSEMEGEHYSLPTEAQWEYACRAGSTTKWCFGDDKEDLQQYAGRVKRQRDKTSTVGQREQNGFSLFDIHGNVAEWCFDWYSPDYYRVSPLTDPTGPSNGDRHILRGSPFAVRPPTLGRSAEREADSWGLPVNKYYGFRVARTCGMPAFRGDIETTKGNTQAESASDSWIALFDGKTLEGWTVHGGHAKFEVKDGMIVGTAIDENTDTCLCKGSYSDCVLELEVMCDKELNSGVQIRSHVYEQDTPIMSNPDKTVEEGSVYGYQCEIAEAATGWSGNFVDANRYSNMRHGDRRAWFDDFSNKPEARTAFKDDQWNHYRIVAQGNHIRSWVNDVPCADFHDDMDTSGLIGLQVRRFGQSREPQQVRFRNIRIRQLKPGETID